MLKYFYIYNIRVPAYGLVVILGITICFYIAVQIANKRKHQLSTIVLLGGIGGIGAVIGARILTLLAETMRDGINHLSWNEFMEAGYSYYGGLFGFLIFVYLLMKCRKIDYFDYARNYIFLLPLLHSFWKISCFLGGCCFGIPYDGPCAVVFPNEVNCMSGIYVFPVQLLESITALLITLCLILLRKKEKLYCPVSTYLIMYGFTRFVIEFLRFHNDGIVMSEGHYYSLACIMTGLYLISIKKQVGIKI